MMKMIIQVILITNKKEQGWRREGSRQMTMMLDMCWYLKYGRFFYLLHNYPTPKGTVSQPTLLLLRLLTTVQLPSRSQFWKSDSGEISLKAPHARRSVLSWLTTVLGIKSRLFALSRISLHLPSHSHHWPFFLQMCHACGHLQVPALAWVLFLLVISGFPAPMKVQLKLFLLCTALSSLPGLK